MGLETIDFNAAKITSPTKRFEKRHAAPYGCQNYCTLREAQKRQLLSLYYNMQSYHISDITCHLRAPNPSSGKRIRHSCGYKTFASVFSLSINSSTSATTLPPALGGGSTTLITCNRGSISTPREEASITSIFFFLAFIRFGNVA